ncbi:Hsp20/alpha crystallin family protein [Bacillus tuaregi]|uniref:Hsp20/alpha crystallin family protein n=1 Tax=Bacillus tuaregi TaxID=1816695 RepID=UPI0008F8C050|nr:Hsp20/alpha crystallin family protein [Bacillus tuaregi]
MFDLIPFRKRNEELFGHMLKSFNEVFEQNGLFTLGEGFNSFRTDIMEKENAYYVEAELPGFAKEDISIEYENNQLTIKAKRELLTEEKDKNEKVIRQERHFGEFLRRFYVEDIKDDEIMAKLEDGILKIEIPKRSPGKPGRNKIEIH